MNLNALSPQRTSASFVPKGAGPDSPKDDNMFHPADNFKPSDMGPIRSSPAIMAVGGFATLGGADLVGTLAGKIHPALGVAAGAALGAAAGYELFPKTAGQPTRVLAAAMTGFLGGTCGYGGASGGGAATLAVLSVVGAGAGAMTGHMSNMIVARTT